MFHNHLASALSANVHHLRNGIIRTMPESALENTVTETLAHRVCEPLLLSIPTLHIDQMRVQLLARRDDWDIQEAVCIVPFDGDGNTFQYSGSSYPLIDRGIEVAKGELRVQARINKRDPDTEIVHVKADLERIVNEGLNPLAQAIPHYNESLLREAKAAIEARKAGIAQHQSFTARLEAIVPIKARDDSDSKVIVPVERKSIAVSTASATPTKPATPEFIISETAYDEILKVITAMIRVVERSPTTFRAMDEEALRTILLVGLNGNFEGAATGETFNGAGKTDILVRANDQNVFIAECLIWKGEKIFRSKLDDQLFRYATWNDSKLAILVFNRRKNFTAVVENMKAVCDSHPQRIRTLPYSHPSGARYEFRRQDDPRKKFTLTALAFEVPEDA